MENSETAPSSGMRFDLQVVASWIEPGSKVLDLGCGEGHLLRYLKEKKQVAGAGIERVETRTSRCIEKGLSVLQGDINEEVLDYPDLTFDYVILSQTLQQVYEPSWLINEILRIGKKWIVSFPNFSHWGIRLQLLAKGRAPISRELPYQWYDTPNIRVITLKDFRRFSKEAGFKILKEVAISTYHYDTKGRVIDFLPSVFATYGIFLIGK
jgi:methionine biosynthesis protein MetW